jgi:hypothetical protein
LLEFFRDPLNQFAVTTALAVIAVLVAIVLHRLSRPTRSLSHVVARTRLLSVDDRTRDKVEIRYGGQLVPTVDLISVKIVNDGRQPIAARDVATPLLVELPAETQVLSAEVGTQKPRDLRPVLAVSGHSISVEPLLLNPGDQFEINILAAAALRGPVRVTGRIEGVSHIGPVGKSSLPGIVGFSLGLVVAAAGGIVSRGLPAPPSDPNSFLRAVSAFALVFGGFATLVSGLLLLDRFLHRRVKHSE